MKALLLKNYKELELTDMPMPQIGPDDLLVKVAACGICGSDVHGYDGSTGRRLPPIVMGHEAAGLVAGIGSNVKLFQEGDRVTFDSTVYCGNCYFCTRGDNNLCDNRQVLGVSTPDFRRHGAFAEYVSVPQRICYKLPGSLPFERAAMIEAVSVGVHAANLTPMKLGDTAIVVGTGMIGLLTLQALKLNGAGRIIAVDIDDVKLNAAAKLGADVLINSKAGDAVAQIKDLTGGRGADVAVECVGAGAPVKTALDSIRKGGTLTLVGNITPTIEINLQSVVTRQIRVQGSCASCGEYPACIDLMDRGAIQVDPMITAKAPLEEGISWFRRLYAHEPNVMKVILQP